MGEREKVFLRQIRMITHLMMFVFSLGLLFGCGVGKEVEGKEPYLEGAFVDGPVSGLNFKTVSVSGQTDSNGIFKYRDGDTITFSIGEIVLGSVKAKALISPVDLVPGATDAFHPTVTNIAAFLQTLDHDGYLNNGIQIPLGIDPIITESILNNGRIDFNQSPKTFAIDRAVVGLLEDLNAIQKFAENTAGAVRRLISAQDARTHLQACFSERKEIATSHGKVKGFALDNKTWAWFGIPYAKPPLGDLRWRAPQPPDKWFGALDSTAHCMPCTQQIHNLLWQPSERYMGSEDCLYLDIYRPKTDETDLPVYVWIHGGINTIGRAADYDAKMLAQRGNMIVVVIQYRLGPMGWFTHPALRDTEDELDASGNYGMLDHIEALRWVRENIAAFGGDSNSVTLGGQSAGAHNVLNLVVSSDAKGLFNKVVLHSPSMAHRKIEQGDRVAKAMIDWLLIDDESAENKEKAELIRARMSAEEVTNYLRSKAVAKIIDACRIGVGGGIMLPHAAFQDGRLLPKSDWIKSIASGRYNKVPMLIGSTEFEFKNLMPLHGKFLNNRFPSVPSGRYTWSDLYKVLDGNLPLSEVFPTQQDKAFYNTVGHLKSRLWKAVNVDAVARSVKADDASIPVFAYRFDWSGGGDSNLNDFNFVSGASHGMELPFFFGSLGHTPGYPFTDANRSGRIALQEAMMDYLINFIVTAQPNSPESNAFEWPQWSNTDGDPKFITFDAGLINMQLSVSSDAELLPSVLADISAARKRFNSAGELGYMNFFGLTLRKKK